MIVEGIDCIWLGNLATFCCCSKPAWIKAPHFLGSRKPWQNWIFQNLENLIFRNWKNQNVKIATSKFWTAKTLECTASSKFWNGFRQGIFSIYWLCEPLPNFGEPKAVNSLVSQKLVKFQSLRSRKLKQITGYAKSCSSLLAETASPRKSGQDSRPETCRNCYTVQKIFRKEKVTSFWRHFSSGVTSKWRHYVFHV